MLAWRAGGAADFASFMHVRVIVMSANRPFSLITDLQKLDRCMVELPCPGCGAREPHPIWRRDRYFLAVDLSACRKCGLVYLARGLSGESQSMFYERIYPRLMVQPPPPGAIWDYRLIAGYRYSEISSVIGGFDAVLDIGAGLGFFLDACRAHGCQQLMGLEPGRPQREHAANVLCFGESVRSEEMSEDTELPFAPRLITLFHVLEHLEDPGRVLRRLAELIDPQGWLVIEVPDIDADWRGLGLQQVHVSHRSYFTEQTLDTLLRRSGFSVQRSVREGYGIYEGNLRVYARLEAQPPAEVPPTSQQLRELTLRIKAQIRPLSLRNGYPRAAVRLLRRALRDL